MNPFQSKKYWIGKEEQIRPDWEEIKISVMRELIFQKFTNNPQLKQMLLDTEDALLEEGNTWEDTYWGICNGIGENNLGKILMEIRDSLKQ